MAAPEQQGKPKFFHRQYLLERGTQLPFALLILGVLVGLGTLYAGAVWFLADTHLMRDRSAGEVRTVLLLVHTGYGVIGGGILFISTLLLTHRFVGPSFVMRQAVAKMRRGDFTGRLNLRRRDYHKELAEELRQLRDELAERHDRRTLTLESLEACLAKGDVAGARILVAELREQPQPDEESAAA